MLQIHRQAPETESYFLLKLLAQVYNFTKNRALL